MLVASNTVPLSITDALHPEHIANPYPLYHQLRSDDPVRWDEGAKSWVVTRYVEVFEALRDARFSAVRFTLDPAWFPEEVRETITAPSRALTRQMLFLDPPDHTRLRGLVAKAFTPRVIDGMRTQIQQIVDELLDAVQAKGEMELIQDFAYPLPAIVIAQMLGVPLEDREQFIRWTGSFGALLGGFELTIETVIQALYDISDFINYFRQLIAQRRLHPKDDLMQAMITAEEQGDKLTEEELLANCVLLLAAGHGTTTHLIGNGMRALLQHPDQLQDLQAHPRMISSAVAELLRYDGPVQLTSRHVNADLQLGGKAIAAGQEVLLSLGAANHDPAQFANPDELNLRRMENRHLAFGQGIHYCLGAPLARVEAEIAFNTLLQRLQEPRLVTTELEWSPSLVFRAMRVFPMTFSPSAQNKSVDGHAGA